MDGGNRITGLPTGIKCLDLMLNGLHGTQVTLIAARPAVGKSALLQQIVLNVAKNGVGAMLFSYEMSKGEISMRQISCEAQIDSKRMEMGGIEDYEWDKIVGISTRVSQLPIFIMDDPGVEVNQLESMIMSHIKETTKHPIGLLAFDYVQIIPCPNKFGSREQEVSKVSRTLKRIAMSTKLPVIAAAQINRDSVKGDKPRRPQLQDLRESGALEQDSNNIIFLHSEDYEKIKNSHGGGPPPVLNGDMELIIAKQRGGKTGVLKVKFEPRFTRFSDPEDESEMDPFEGKDMPY